MTTCRFLKQEPSFSSIKPKVLRSRIVRAQPPTTTSLPESVSLSAKIAAILVRSIYISPFLYLKVV